MEEREREWGRRKGGREREKGGGGGGSDGVAVQNEKGLSAIILLRSLHVTEIISVQ